MLSEVLALGGNTLKELFVLNITDWAPVEAKWVNGHEILFKGLSMGHDSAIPNAVYKPGYMRMKIN